MLQTEHLLDKKGLEVLHVAARTLDEPLDDLPVVLLCEAGVLVAEQLLQSALCTPV